MLLQTLIHAAFDMTPGLVLNRRRRAIRSQRPEIGHLRSVDILRLAAVVDIHRVLATTARLVGVERTITQVDHVVGGKLMPHALVFTQTPNIPQSGFPLVGLGDAGRQVLGSGGQDGPRGVVETRLHTPQQLLRIDELELAVEVVDPSGQQRISLRKDAYMHALAIGDLFEILPQNRTAEVIGVHRDLQAIVFPPL